MVIVIIRVEVKTSWREVVIAISEGGRNSNEAMNLAKLIVEKGEQSSPIN